MLFTDESRFCLTKGDGQIRVFHQRNERYTTSHTARSVRDFLKDMNVFCHVFCHGQRRAQISIPLSTSGTCWIRGGGLGPFPPKNVRELEVP